MKQKRLPARRLGAVDAVVQALVALAAANGNPVPPTAMRQRLNALRPESEGISVALTNMVEKPVRGATTPADKAVAEINAQIRDLKAKKAALIK